MTLRELEKKLAAAKVDSPRADTLTLAEHVSGVNRASLLARYDSELRSLGWSAALLAELLRLVGRRADREPLQYILGKWEFYGDEYEVSPDCLIPRSETEMLVDFAVERLPRAARVADLCCGSGCVGIAVCRNTDAVCDSVDVSAAALSIAKRNAQALGVGERVSFSEGDVLVGEGLGGGREYEMILSNPPYVKTSEMRTLSPEVKREPAIALDGGADGMKFYRAIIDNYASMLSPGGAFVFEIGAELGGEIAELASARGFSAVIKNDLSSLPRMAVLTRAGKCQNTKGH